VSSEGVLATDARLGALFPPRRPGSVSGAASRTGDDSGTPPRCLSVVGTQATSALLRAGAGACGAREIVMAASAEGQAPFYVRYYVGHKGKFGHEFLEFELTASTDSGGPGKLRYANQSGYRRDSRIRKEAFVSPAVIAEAERFIRDARVIDCDDEKWPEPDSNGRQELEVILDDEHVCFAVRSRCLRACQLRKRA